MHRLIAAAGDPPPAGAIDVAAAALEAGEVVGLPTDTVYGLAAHGSVPGATAAIFELKGRPPGLALPVLVSGEDQALALVGGLGPAARALTRRFWPGGLTVVLPRRPGVDLDLGGDPGTVGVRCPDHPVALALCARVGPLPTTSANPHGRPPFTVAGDVAAAFPGIVVLDAGRCDRPPSTVVDCTGPEVTLVREGTVPWPDVLDALAGAGG